MEDRIQLPLNFKPELMQADLKLLQSTPWIEHFVKQNYNGEWSVIPLRGPANAIHPVMMIYSDPGCTDFQDTPFLGLTHYFPEVLSTFECPLQAVRLMKLSPGAQIKEHNDFDLDAGLGHARLHIPVITNDQVDFRLNGTRVILNAGECWYLRLSDPHSVVNSGNADRIHLVLDVIVNDWLRKNLTV